MTFIQAKKKLEKIAKKEFYSLRFSVTKGLKLYKTECAVYINGYSWYGGNTWQEAFYKLDQAMNPRNYVEEIPNNLSD